MEIVESPEAARSIGEGARGLVPTMGYLHEGHLSLAEAARRMCDVVVMSLFVNPLQFDDPADLDRYPRDLTGTPPWPKRRASTSSSPRPSRRCIRPSH